MTASLLHIGEMTVKAGWTTNQGKHAHADLEIMVMLDGQLAIDLEKSTVIADTGSIFFYATGLQHFETAGKAGAQFIFLGINREAAIEAPCHLPDADRRVTTLARWLLQERETSFPGRQDYLDGLTRSLLLEIERLGKVQPAHPLHRIRQYMRTHLQEPLSVDQLAALANLSRYHFCRKYRELTGNSPMKDLQAMRIDAAVDILLTSTQPLKSIADAVGLADEYHLSRVFRRLRGQTPGALRKHSS